MAFQNASAEILELRSHQRVIGKIRVIYPEAGESLYEAGLRYGVGLNEMRKANPSVPEDLPLSAGQKLVIPSQYILPPPPHRGIVVDLSAYRLYFFPSDENIVVTYPIGIGRKGWKTPAGRTKIVAKQVNPVWHPTRSVRLNADRHGVMLPDAVPGGMGNPLGKYILRLGWPAILIHGSNRADGIGDRVSAGCIRMLPNDMAYLFTIVKVGTSVRVLR